MLSLLPFHLPASYSILNPGFVVLKSDKKLMNIMLPVDDTGLGKIPVNESREPAVSSAPSYMLTKS